MSGEFYRLFEQPRPCLDGGNCDKNPATVCLGLSSGFCLVQYSSDDDGGDIEDLYIIGAVCMYVCQQKSLFVYSKNLF